MKSKFFPSSARRIGKAVVIAAAMAAVLAGVRVIAQAPFPSALERQLWKELLPMGDDLADSGLPNYVPIPRRVSVNVPSTSRIEIGLDEFLQPYYQSVTDPSSLPGTPEQQAAAAYEIEKVLLQEGECTFSHRGDYDGSGPQWRQCKNGALFLPPPPGALLDPVGLAVDGSTVYVVDDFNHRVQAFDFEGRVRPMQFPIGNGIPGSGTYSYAGYLPYAGFPGFETSDWGSAGSQLNAPNGIAVDAASNLVIADAGNQRIAVFANTGAPVTEFLLPDYLGRPTKPTLVAITPGATVLAPGSTIPVGREGDRIVVTDWSHCFVHIYKTNFELVKSLPEALPAISAHDACKAGDPTPAEPWGATTLAGEFSTVTGATIDATGHIYISDHAQNVVQVFDINGVNKGWIGKPGQQAAPGELWGPVGVAIDHLGRVGVIDGYNSRVVFYTVAYPGGVANATFEFQLDVTVSVEDFPMGLVEQVGNAVDGLDPKGRFLATDPWNRRVLRFELPELGIVDADAFILPTQPPVLPVGAPVGALVGQGSFKVAVPRQKTADVLDVETFVVPVEAGVTVVPGSIVPTNEEVPAIDIGPGEFVNYTFSYYTEATVTQATFTINAHGDRQPDGSYLAEADPAEAKSRASCVGCDATHEVYWFDQDLTPGLATEITNPTTGSWYPDRVFVRLLPIPADGSVTSIAWYYEGAAATFYSGGTTESDLGTNGYVDVPVGVSGASRVVYWAVTGEGSIGTPHTVDLNIDLQPPTANFIFWPPYTGTADPAGQRWYNHNVTAGYTASDSLSGTDADTQTDPSIKDGDLPPFTSEGRNQSQNLVLTDRVGHDGDINSATASGGRVVNIDKTAPVFTTVPAPITVVANGWDENGGFALLPPGWMVASADDPVLPNGPGSGVMPIAAPGTYRFPMGVSTWTYTATDYAGNSATATTTVTVTPATATITAGDRTVRYGDTLVVSALVEPYFASGVVTFTFGPPSAPYTATGNVVGRIAGATIPNVFAPVGQYTMTVSLSGDPALGDISTTATVTVIPAPVRIAAIPKTKVYGSTNPTFEAVVDGLLNGDGLNYTLVSTATDTSGVGLYPIEVVVGENNDNYVVTKEDSTLTVTPKPASITANGKSRFFGEANPTLDATPSGVLFGDALVYTLSTTAVPASNIGSYPIEVDAPAALNPNYTLTTTGSTLVISAKPVTVTVNPKSRYYGDSNPTLDAVVTGEADGFPISYTLSTAAVPGSPVNSYPIIAAVTANPNYAFTVNNSSLAVTPRPATVTANNKSRAFGVSNPVLNATVTNVFGTDTLNYALATTAVPLSPVGGYPITVTLGSNPNYAVTSTDGTLTVTQATVTVTANAKSKTYGDANPALDAVVAGLPVGASLNYSLSTTATANSGVSTYPIAVELGLNPDFAVTATDAVLTITPRPIAVTADGKESVYGAAVPALTYTFTGTLAGTDAFSGALDRAPGTTPGTYPINQGTLALDGVNYALSFTGANLVITKKTATVTAGGGTKVYGTADPAFGTTQSGFLASDNITSTASRANLSENVGTYQTTAVAAGPGLDNYTITYEPGVFTITKARVTVTPTSVAVIYGDPQPSVFAVTYGPFPGSATVADITTAPVCTVSGPSTAVGTYPITCTGGDAANFDFEFLPGSLTVNLRAATVTAGSGTKTFGAVDPALITTFDNVLAGDVAGITFATTRAAGNAVGTYATNATATGGNASNYVFAYEAGTFTITPATPTIVLTGGTFTYDGAVHAGVCTVTGAGGTLTGTLSYSPGPNAPLNVSTTTVTCSRAADLNYEAVTASATITILPKAITVTADPKTKIVGAGDPALTYSITLGGPLVGTDSFSGSLTRDAGEAVGAYAIRVGTLTAGLNYAMTFVSANLTIAPNNLPPNAVDDSAAAIGSPVTIAVLANDADPDGDALVITAVTQPTGGVGTVAIVGNTLVFTPATGFASTATFTYTVSDGRGGTDTATVTVTSCNLAGYRTQSQGGWGSSPSVNNPGAFLAANFATAWPSGVVTIGGTNTLRFTSAHAIEAFLPAGGTPNMLTASAEDPTSTYGGGSFAGQVLALQISVDLSRSGVTRGGLGGLVLAHSMLVGRTVDEVLALANAVLGGNHGALPAGLSIAGLSTILEYLNLNFEDGTHNNGIVVGPGCSSQPVPTANTAPDAGNDTTSVKAGKSVDVAVKSNDVDADGNQLSVAGVSHPSQGSATILSTGKIRFKAPAHWTGTTSFTYTIQDGHGGSDTATVTVTVTP